jgi:hypothetical protein
MPKNKSSTQLQPCNSPLPASNLETVIAYKLLKQYTPPKYQQTSTRLQSGAGVGFLRVLRFPLPIVIAPNASQSPSSIIWGWYNRPEVGLGPTPLAIKKKANEVF